MARKNGAFYLLFQAHLGISSIFESGSSCKNCWIMSIFPGVDYGPEKQHFFLFKKIHVYFNKRSTPETGVFCFPASNTGSAWMESFAAIYLTKHCKYQYFFGGPVNMKFCSLFAFEIRRTWGTPNTTWPWEEQSLANLSSRCGSMASENIFRLCMKHLQAQTASRSMTWTASCMRPRSKLDLLVLVHARTHFSWIRYSLRKQRAAETVSSKEAASSLIFGNQDPSCC